MKILFFLIIIFLIWLMTRKKIQIERSYYADTISYSEIYSRCFNRFFENFQHLANDIAWYYFQIQEMSMFALAQTILETANHKKIIKYIISKNSSTKEYPTKNLFCIRYGSKDPAFSNFFRIYIDYESSIEDYVALLSNLNIYRQHIEKLLKKQTSFENAYREISKKYCPDDEKYFDKVYSIMKNLSTPPLIDTPYREIALLKLSDLIKV